MAVNVTTTVFRDMKPCGLVYEGPAASRLQDRVLNMNAGLSETSVPIYYYQTASHPRRP
jgi:hypothetical protein